MQWSRFLLAMVFWPIGVFSLLGEEEVAPPAMLSNEAYREREKTTEELFGWAQQGNKDENRKVLLGRYFSSEDPEVRFRLREALYQISLDQIEQSGPGFLGVQMGRGVVRQLPGGQMLMEEPEFVLVSLVLENSPAEAAGIQPGDQIVRIDEVNLKIPKASAKLQEYVGGLGPGTEIEIELNRGEEKIVTVAKLMSRLAIDEPDDAFRGRGLSKVDPEKREQLLRDDFASWLRQQKAPEAGEELPQAGPAENPTENR